MFYRFINDSIRISFQQRRRYQRRVGHELEDLNEVVSFFFQLFNVDLKNSKFLENS